MITNYSFLYLWIDCRGRFYIGSHKGVLDDGYIAHGWYAKSTISTKHRNLICSEYKKRPEDFVRVILAIGEYHYIRELESKYQIKVNAAKNPLYYNKWNSQSNGYYTDWTGRKRKYHTPWNKGLTKSDPRIKMSIEKSTRTIKKLHAEGKLKMPSRRGTTMPENTKKALKLAQENMSESTRNKLRKSALKQWDENRFGTRKRKLK